MKSQAKKRTKKRLAIIGGGSSGLITLKMALDYLTDWEVICFEKSDSITGCWGNPYPGFVSTSTRYTTQFTCYPLFDGVTSQRYQGEYPEFFCGSGFGDYLESFADHFDLRPHIRLNQNVESLDRHHLGGWVVTVDGESSRYDAVVVCTGLAAKAKKVQCSQPTLPLSDLARPGGLEEIKDRKIVVLGGGESAVDIADRLAKPALRNEVYLSLRSGIRVSPRYHPIRGVPSDFLRNRLLLSIHPDIRNWLGEKFVQLRIKYQPRFERLWPTATGSKLSEKDSEILDRKKDWSLRLKSAAKDRLFNMFHNKSDDFLDAVGEQRIQIIGMPNDETFNSFQPFDNPEGESIVVNPDLIVPSLGYEATLCKLAGTGVKVSDFYLGCSHVSYSDLFLVGFARPIIGNIPSISELQAQYVVMQIAGKLDAEPDREDRHRRNLRRIAKDYPALNVDSVYPVEMIPYCDHLARLMKLPIGPSLFRNPTAWWRCKTSPATTMHYYPNAPLSRKRFESTPTYLPGSLTTFLLLLKPLDWVYKMMFGNRQIC